MTHLASGTGYAVQEDFSEPMPGNTQEASTFGINEQAYGYDASGAGDFGQEDLSWQVSGDTHHRVLKPVAIYTRRDWEHCLLNTECISRCCSGTYSGGALKCTPLSGGFNPSICTAGNSPGNIWITVQAESYSNSFGVVPENTSDVGGGQNVGNLNTGDWMSYPAVTIPTTGAYRVSYRVAGYGGSLQLERAGGSQVFGSVVIPWTGGWQNWQTVSHTVYLSAGSLPLGIKVTSGGWNINWLLITNVVW
jgi:hypothetical protein